MNIQADTVQLGMTASISAADLIDTMGREAREASQYLATASTEQKNKALLSAAGHIRRIEREILAANAIDMEAAGAKGLTGALLDRLLLNPARVEAMAVGLEEIAALPDPIGAELAQWTRPNGLSIRRVRTPLGVIGVIYESRPNVTADAGALCLKAGNAVILRGGSESFHSSRAIHAALLGGLKDAGLPLSAIQLVPTTDQIGRAHV
jgi:glutamate-5-semialdehyde dehydrogenase